MANTLTPLIDKLIARGLEVLRENAIMPRLVNSTYTGTAASRGDTITVPVSADITAGAVSPSNTLAAGSDSTLTSKTISLNQWYKAGFFLTDQQITQIDVDNFNTLQGDEAVRSLANNVDDYILGLYKGVYSNTGTAGTTPFASNLNDWTTGARVKLNTNKAPLEDRFVVLDADAEGNAINQRALQDASWRGDADGIRFGDIGYALGANWHIDQNVPTFTNSNGTPTSYLVNNGSGYSSGATKTIAVDTVDATTQIVVGDSVLNSSQALIGVVASITATSITFVSNIAQTLADDAPLWVAGRKAASTTDLSLALTDDIDLIPYVGVQCLSGSARHIYLHNEKISRVMFE